MNSVCFSFLFDALNEQELSSTEISLLNLAKEACNNSYSPYSHFQVGCSILLENGIFIKGSNQENAAYPSGLCAERTTLFYAKSSYPTIPIQTMAIAAMQNGEYTSSPITPCGSCRQVFLEYAQQQKNPITLLLYGTKCIYRIKDVRHLLPLQFGANDITSSKKGQEE